MFALLDCNNFFVSCERVFAPHLWNRPVLVLSNNDGCVISRSKEVKDLGIAMGAPFFKVREQCQKHQVEVFSSNFELYGDMSARVMSIIGKVAPDHEIYSIDEAFLHLATIPTSDHETFCQTLREQVKDWTGIPVSIGIAPTKVLCKIANMIAKKYTVSGVFDLSSPSLQERILSGFPVGDIWGIGSKLSKKLEAMGIYTAKDLRDANRNIIRSCLSVVGLRIVDELRGISCLGLEEIEPKKQIMASRSFGKPVTECHELEEAIACYVTSAAMRLRSQQSITGAMYVYIRTNHFQTTDKSYAKGVMWPLPIATDYTPDLISMAKQMVRHLYLKGYRYQKAGVVLLDLVDAASLQYNLFAPPTDSKHSQLMPVMDGLNRRFGKKTIHFLATGFKKNWRARQDSQSPRYTTRWDELPSVN
ncbi:MAG: Y-family DNA polymerase [Alphaproteobacteria bacterium]|nr:Y-family DNA polymerase [Alphaproteobacteria bacterium]